MVWTILLLVLGAAAGFGFVQTRTGKGMLASWTEKAVEAATGLPLRVGTIEGLVPLDFTVESLSLGDRDDPWLRVERASLIWFPGSLLRGELRIGAVQAETVSILRRPRNRREKPDPEPDTAFRLPSLPPVFLERFSLDRLVVDGSVLGEEALFTASGRMALIGDEGSIQGDFQVRRLDAPEERAGVRWTLQTEPASLTLDLYLVEPENGMLSRLAGVRPGAARLRVSGSGPPGDWKGRLEAESAAWGDVQSDLRIARGENGLSLEARGDLRLRRDRVPREAIGLLPDGLCRYTLKGSIGENGVLSVERLALNAQGAEVRISGRFDPGEAQGEALADLSIPDLGRLHVPGLATPSGALKVEVRMQGPLLAPEVDLEVEVSGLEAGGVKAESAVASFRVRPEEGARLPGLAGLRVEGRGAFTDAVFRAAEEVFSRKRTDWAVDARMASQHALAVSRLRVSDGNIDAGFNGRLGLEERVLNGRVSLSAADLSRAPFLEKSGVQGNASLRASIQGSGFSRSIFADVKGRLKEWGPVPRALEALAGGDVSFEGRVSLLDGRKLQISGFRAVLPGAECSLEGSADLLDRTVEASVRGIVPDAALLSRAAGRELRGRLQVAAGLSGPFEDPQAHIDVVAKNPSVEGFGADELRFAFEGRPRQKVPKGRVSLSVQRRDVSLRARADSALEETFLHLDGLSVEGVGARITGNLVLHVPSGTVRGELNGTAPDLAPLAALWEEEAGGRAGFAIRLFEDEGAQNASLDLRVDDLGTRFGRARRIDLSGEVRNGFKDASGEVKARVEAFRDGSVRLETMTLDTRGGIGDLAFDLEGTGSAGKPFRVSAAGGVRWSGKESALALETFEGAFDARELKLARPAALHHDPGSGLRAEPFRFQVGQGRVEVSGRIGDRVDANADFERIPLSLLTLAGGPPMAGEASGRVRLSGTRQDPSAEAEVTIKDAGLTDPEWRHLPETDLDARASLQGGRLVVQMTADEGEGRRVEAGLTVPLRASLAPFSLEPVRHGNLEGHVAANLDLEPLPAWLSLEGHRISGRLEADLSMEGSVADPLVAGVARVREGAYELLRTGSVFRDAEVLVRVEGKEVILEHARAADGNGGRIEASGVCQPLPEQGFPFNGRLTMRDFRLVRLDDLSAKTGADLEISGTVSGADLAGTIEVLTAEVRIPDRLPPKVRELDVVEVKGGPEAGVEKGPSSPPSAKGPGIALDLDVRIPGRTFVRGRGLDSEWKGRLRVSGTADRPEVQGDLAVVRGHYDFFGERFSLASGTLLFDGSHPPDPWMDVTAERRRADMTGRVTLSGTPSTLRVQVSSEPPLPRDEVMARLLFGRSLTSITPVQALKLARATDALAGGGTFGFLDRAQQAVGLDQVEVIQSDGGGSTALSVGKYVGEGAYVEVEKGLGSDDGKVSVEYEVAPKITVETEVGADAAGGVEIKWNWDY